jgi:hypothetical protein
LYSLVYECNIGDDFQMTPLQSINIQIGFCPI